MSGRPELAGIAALIISALVLLLSLILYFDARRIRRMVEATLTQKVRVGPPPVTPLQQIFDAAMEGMQEGVESMIQFVVAIFHLIALPVGIVIVWTVVAMMSIPEKLDTMQFALRFPLLLVPGPFLASIVPYLLALYHFGAARGMINHFAQLTGRTVISPAHATFGMIGSSIGSVVSFCGSVATLVGEAPLRSLYKALTYLGSS